MGKWNKAPPEVSEQFLQNEQRRKQMIVQAARRRKQKQKKLQQQAQVEKKNEQQALIKHKQQKKDVYIKYLRNNMHDKYQEMKRNSKLNEPQVRSKSKWKKDTIQQKSNIKNQNNLQSLNLQVNIQNKKKSIQARTYNKTGGQVTRNEMDYQQNFAKIKQTQVINEYQNNNLNYNLNKNEKKTSQKRRMLQNQFEDMWKQQNEIQQQNKDQFQYNLSAQESVFDDLIGSRLLDSLDLDLDTVSRGKKLDKRIKQENKNFNKKKVQVEENKEVKDIKNMIGYQSVLMSIDERSEMIKKYNQFMTNQVQQPKINDKLLQNQKQNTSKNNQNKDKNVKTSNKNNPKLTTQQKQTQSAKPLTQGEYFNQLKNKKQGKILNWANQQASEADDLFSNCSTNKKSKTRGFQMLKQINKQIQQNKKTIPVVPSQVDMKKKQKPFQKPLQIIPQKRFNASKQRLRERSYQKKNPPSVSNTANNNEQKLNNPQPLNSNKSHQMKRSVSQQKIIQVSKARANRLNSTQQNSKKTFENNKVVRDTSKQKVNITVSHGFNNNRNTVNRTTQSRATQPRNRTQSRRSLSKQKQNNIKSSKELNTKNVIPGYGYGKNISKIQAPPKAQNPYTFKQQNPNSSKQNINTTGPKLSHLPPPYQKPIHYMDQITVATQDQRFQVESFIKNQLLALNKQQRQIQQQLKNIHLSNKQKIKDIQKKHEIKTDYKYSYEIKQNNGEQIDEQIESNINSYNQVHKKQNEFELEDSIQRLDDMLLRREILMKQKHSRITEQDNQSQSTARSVINPMADPIQLHKQVLQLAQNLSRFQGQPQNIDAGYGAKIRMKKKSQQKNKISFIKKSEATNKNETQIDLSESQDVNYSQINSNAKQSKVSSKISSKVSRPPQLDYFQNNNYCLPNTSDLLDDEIEDSIEKGKVQVNQKLRNMLLE